MPVEYQIVNGIVHTTGSGIVTYDSKRAVVTNSDLFYGLSRIYAAYQEMNDLDISGPEMCVFKNFNEAQQWLNS
jgi:nitrous oxidase accessory protein NosD